MTVKGLLPPTQENSPVQLRQITPCPNCGQNAIRILKSDLDSGGNCRSGQVTCIECSTCDYLLVSCSLTGEVVEAYAPSLQMSHWKIRSHPKKVFPAA